MSLDKRFIGAISKDDEEILNTFLENTGVKKSNLIRTFIRSLKDIDADTMEIIVVDKNHVKSMALFNNLNSKTKQFQDKSTLELYGDRPYSVTIKSNGKGEILTTRIVGEETKNV